MYMQISIIIIISDELEWIACEVTGSWLLEVVHVLRDFKVFVDSYLIKSKLVLAPWLDRKHIIWGMSTYKYHYHWG